MTFSLEQYRQEVQESVQVPLILWTVSWFSVSVSNQFSSVIKFSSVNPVGDFSPTGFVEQPEFFAAALRVAKKLGKGKTVVALLPDTGERYLSTGIFNKE